MEHQVKELPKSQVEIRISLTKEELKPFAEKAMAEFSKQLKVKGFRPGHIPAEIVKEHLSDEALKYRTQDLAIQATYPKAVVESKTPVISRPHVKIESEDDGLVYIATAAIMPKVEVKDHKSIKVKHEEAKIDKKDVDEVLNDLKRYITTYKDVERAAKKGDRAELAFEGFDLEGKALEGTKSQNHPVILGEGSLIPGFEDNVIGLKVGEKTDFEITFPEDYHSKEFASKKVKFNVELQRLEEATIPELDEESIEKLTGKKEKPEELIKKIEHDLLEQKKNAIRQKREGEYLEELLKKTKVELPEILIEEEVQHMIAEVRHSAESRGMKWDDYLAQAKTTPEDLYKKYEPEAEKRVKLRLALQHLIEEEKTEPTADEIKKVLDAELKRNPKADPRSLEFQIRNRLALRAFFAKVLGNEAKSE